MPAKNSADELQWKVWSDFTGGLYERGTERDVPDNGLTVLEDAMPLFPGGLRAAMKFDRIVNSSQDTTSSTASPVFGLPASSNVVTGYFNYYNLGPSSGRMRHFLILAPPGSGDIHFWESFSSDENSLTAQFTTMRAFTTGTGERAAVSRMVRFAQTGTTEDEQLYFTMPRAASTSLGIWAYDEAGAFALVAAGRFTFIEPHQARLFAVTTAANERQRIAFSDVQGDANITSTNNNFLMATERPGNVSCMYARMPSDMAILKKEHGWFTLQGEASKNPTLIESARVHPSQENSWACETPFGLTYLTKNEGVYAFTGGPEPTHLSPQFVGSPFCDSTFIVQSSTNRRDVWLGQPAFGGHWLFTPRGLVMDVRSKAWFRLSQFSTGNSHAWWQYEPVTGNMWTVRHTGAPPTSTGGVQMHVCSMDESAMDRTTSYVFEVPLLYNLGVRTVLRELEYHIQSFSSGSKIEVAVSAPDPATGVEVVTTLAPVVLPSAASHMVRIQVGLPSGMNNSDWFKIQTRMSNPHGEAPLTAMVRAGYTLADARFQVRN